MSTAAAAAASAVAASTPTKLDIVHAYRRLLRGGLQAVQFSHPARFVVRDKLRAAFREKPKDGGAAERAFDAGVVKRTAWFLEAAARDRGVEHRVVKNLVLVHLERQSAVRDWRRALAEDKNRKLRKQQMGFYQHYDMTLAMMNKSLGTALR